MWSIFADAVSASVQKVFSPFAEVMFCVYSVD